MKSRTALLATLLAALPGAAAGLDARLQAVNIFQGTDSERGFSHGNTLPLVGLPWGMTDWSIQNAPGNWFFKPNGKIGGFRAIREAKEMAAEPFGQYNQGNQPSFNYLYLFAELGQPWKTEYWTRRVCAEVFNSGVDGFPGDEDNGSMASRFIFSSMGFYPSCPGSDKYILTAPLFEQVNLRLPTGKTFVINTTDNSPKNTHVLQQKLNGEKVSRIWLSQEEICRGGTWELTLGVSPK